MASATLIARLVGDAKSLVESFEKGEQSAGSFGSSMESASKKAALFGLAVAAAAGGAVVGAIKHFADFGSEIYDMSQRTGLGAEKLTELKFAAEQSGTSLDGLETGIRKMQIAITNASQGNVGLIDNFSRLGISVSEIAALKPDEQFDKIVSAIAAIPDPTQRAAAAVDFFGKTGTQLLPMLDGGAKGFADLKQRAHELGVVMTDEMAAKADRLGDAMDQLKAAMFGVTLGVGSALAPAIATIATAFANAIPGAVDRTVRAFSIVSDFLREHPSLLAGVATAIFALLVPALLTGAGAAWAMVAGFVAAAAPALAIVAAIGAVVAAVVWLGRNWDSVFDSMPEGVQNVLRAVKTLAESFVSALKTAIDWLIDQLNKIKFTVPDWVPGIGGKGFDGFNIPKIEVIFGAIADVATNAVHVVREAVGGLGDAIGGLGGAAAGAGKAAADAVPNLGNYGAAIDHSGAAAAAAQKALDELARKQQGFFDTIKGIESKFQADQVQAYLEGGQQKLDAVKVEQAAMMVEARTRAVDLQRLWGMDFATALKTSIDYLSAGAKNLAESSKLAAEGVSRVFAGFGNAANMESIADNAGRVFAFFGTQGQAGSGSGFFAPGQLPAGSTGLFTAGPNGIPQFADGGVVPGPRGRPQLAIVHGGEYVSPNGRGGGVTIVVNVQGSLVQQSDLKRQIVAAVAEAAGRGAFRGTPLGTD